MSPTRLFPVLSLLGLLLLTGCLTSREARIESSYSYGGRFRHYRTYDFLGGRGLTADSTRLSAALREAVKQRLRVQGYRYSRRNPDLMVGYQLFEGDMRFPGFVQPDLARWIADNEAEDANTPPEQRHTYQPTRLLLLDGTLMVTLIDARTSNAIWHGYASGVTLPEGPRGEYELVRSARAVFDRYRVFTENYLKGGNVEAAEPGAPTPADGSSPPNPATAHR